jgi:hypothetical protein
VGIGRRGRRVEEAGHEQGGSLLTDGQRPKTGGRGRRAPCARCRLNRGGGERLTGGPRQQCRAALRPRPARGMRGLAREIEGGPSLDE